MAIKFIGDIDVLGSHNLVASDIPSLDAAKITSGTLGTARIPNLSASKITSGTFDSARIPSLTSLYVAVGSFSPVEVTQQPDGVLPIVLSDGYNFLLSPTGEWVLDVTVADGDVGKSGTFIINNRDTTSPGSLPTNLKTPNGDSIAWQTDAGDVSILSYFVVNTTTVLVNYIGNFG